MQDEFSKYHPAVNLIYFTVVMLCTMFFNHPAAIAVSLFSALLYSFFQKGTLKNLKYYIVLLFVTAAINPLFNHGGVTVLGYFKSGNPITLESIGYGFAAAGILLASVCWFFVINRVMTSEKIIYLTGRIAPSLSLVISMAMRFVPRFREKLASVSDARRAMAMQTGVKNAVRVFSVMVTAALENSIETADSMHSRGFGTARRTAFSNYKISGRDIAAFFYILVCLTMMASGIKMFRFRYFPRFGGLEISGSAIAGYILLMLMPVLTNIAWEVRWHCTQSKI